MSEHGGAALPHVAPGVNVEAVEAGAQASDVAGHMDNHHHHHLIIIIIIINIVVITWTPPSTRENTTRPSMSSLLNIATADLI